MFEEMVVRFEAGDDDLVYEMADLAAADPGAARPFLRRLVDAGVFWTPACFYRYADEEFQRHVVGRVEGGAGDAAMLVYALAQSRGPVVEDAFRRWRDETPAGVDPYGRGVDALVRDGGWELTGDGTLELVGEAAFKLRAEPADGADESHCPWCDSPLWTALDVDTAAPEVAEALAHTGWSGRLRIVTCALCAAYGTVYAEVGAEGRAAWSAYSEQPAHLPAFEAEPPPAVRMVVADRRATSLQASAWDRGGSTLGGVADWIQDPCFPLCPSCGAGMSYVGLVNGADAWDGEGAFYLYVDAGCGLAAVEYQQS